MMMGFSIFTRRVLAIGILLLLILCSIEFIILPIKDRMQLSRNSLADSRFELARLHDIANRPEPPAGQKIDNSLLLNANEKLAAQNILNDHLLALAEQRGISVNIVFIDQENTFKGLIMADISIAGEESLIMSFIADLENGRPLVRLTNWNINYQEQQPQQIQFESKIMASWISG